MKTGKHRVGNATKPSGQTLHTTCPLDRRWLALDLAAFLFASILAPPASLLKAECKQWDVSGNWVLKQSNGFAIELRLNQNGKELTGTADAKSGGYSDKVQGNIEGNDFYVSIPWGFKRTRVGVYRGTIGSSGRIDGTTYDEKHPQVKATWFSTTAMKCADAAPAAKVLEHPGKVLGSPGKSPAPAATPSRPTAPPQAPPAASAPTIAANPRVVQVDDSQDEGTAILTWDAGPNHPNAEVLVKVKDRDARTLAESSKGTREVKVKPGKTYLYILTDSGQQLGSVTVKGKR